MAVNGSESNRLPSVLASLIASTPPIMVGKLIPKRRKNHEQVRVHLAMESWTLCGVAASVTPRMGHLLTAGHQVAKIDHQNFPAIVAVCVMLPVMSGKENSAVVPPSPVILKTVPASLRQLLVSTMPPAQQLPQEALPVLPYSYVHCRNLWMWATNSLAAMNQQFGMDASLLPSGQKHDAWWSGHSEVPATGRGHLYRLLLHRLGEAYKFSSALDNCWIRKV